MKTRSKIFYRLHRYFCSSRPVFPLAAIMTYIGVMYSMSPMEVNSAYIISAVFLFALMTFVTLSINGKEILPEEHILYLREEKKMLYFVYRDANMLIISFIYSLILALAPIFVNMVNGYHFFSRKLTAFDVITGFILIFVSGIISVGIGDLFNPRVISERKMSLLYTLFLVILSITREGIMDTFKGLKVIRLVLPPIMEPAKVFAKSDVFKIIGVCKIALWAIAYYIIVTIIKIFIMNKRKFE